MSKVNIEIKEVKRNEAAMRQGCVTGPDGGGTKEA